METIKFMYLSDPDVPERVVTLAREVREGGKLRVSWCVNRVREETEVSPNPESFTGGKIMTYQLLVDDPFDKARARLITSGRLYTEERVGRYIELDVKEGTRNVDAMIAGIESEPEVPTIVKHVVARHVEARRVEEVPAEHADENTADS